jgi:quercetin dioxygenase-like cupin family protein
MFVLNTRSRISRLAMAAAIVGTVAAAAVAVAQTAPSSPQPITRFDLQRHDLSIAGHEAIQVRVDIAPGAIAPRHKHPGEEIVYVLKGTLVYELDGQPPVTLKAGDVLFIPAETAHAVRNIGTDSGSELATYVVDKSKPLLVLAE